MDLLELAQGCAYNDRFEADAIQKYTEFLRMIAESEIDENDKNEMTEQIEEIISDELNHQNKLREIYTRLTNIMPNKD